MPQPEEPPGEGQGEPTADDDARSTLMLLRELLFLPRDRVRETIDDAVRRGRMTRGDAEELVDRLVELGRQQTDDVLTVIERLVPGGGSVARALRQMDRTRRGDEGSDELAIADYDTLTAAQVTSRLDGLDTAELRALGEYERRNANRKSVLAAVDKRLA